MTMHFGEAQASVALPVRSRLDAYLASTVFDRPTLVIDIAPAARPATPAIITALELGSAAATPTTSEEIDTIPSFAPRTAAQSQPLRVR